MPQAVQDLNVGIVAMILNLIVTFVVSAFTKKKAAQKELVA
jgi:SSS family solute:Na+ symporter